jgi:hypothetical protein
MPAFGKLLGLSGRQVGQCRKAREVPRRRDLWIPAACSG